MDYQHGLLRQDQLCECRLCGTEGQNYTNVLRLESDPIENFIKENMGVCFRSNNELPTTVCDNCLFTIQKWRNLLTVCKNVQSRFSSRLQLNGESSSGRENVGKSKTVRKCKNQSDEHEEVSEKSNRKTSRFNLEYLRTKIGRELNSEEEAELVRLISNGDDRRIYGFILGSGSNQLWPCQLCSEQIRGTIRDVTKHYETVHQSSPVFPCQLCGKVIRSVHTYKRHRISHLSEYKCTDCGKVFVDRSKLLIHKTTHSNERPHMCKFCDKRFKLTAHLKAHVARTHVGEPEKPPYACDICGKQFTFKGSLTNHVQTTHSDNRPFVCHLCGKGFKYKQALTLHLNSHAGIKLFSCTICQASMTTRASMEAHMRRHTGERPYICSDCGKGFISSSARSSHRQHVHATSRKFVCKVCGKSFKVLRDLKIHGALHSDEKQHVCTTCGRAFRAAANLYSHRKIHRRAEAKQETQEKEVFVNQGQVNDPQNLIDLGGEDPLSQVIREHLSHTLVGEDANLTTLHETQSYVLGQQGNLEQATLMEYVSTENVEFHNLTASEQPSRFLKEILLTQTYDK